MTQLLNIFVSCLVFSLVGICWCQVWNVGHYNACGPHFNLKIVFPGKTFPLQNLSWLRDLITMENLSRYLACWFPGSFHHQSSCSNDIGHYNDVILSAVASQITNVSIVCSTVGSDADKRKHQSFASLAFVRGIYRWTVNSLHKRPVTRNFCQFSDVIMCMR